ncbi:hypothetical protein [Actinoplanes italicus]|nr:hypothetical protein [Actinoplanes italicus]
MDRDEQMVSEFIAGREVPEIAARYGVAEAYVDRVIEQASLKPARRSRDWSLNPLGNRLLYSVLIALVVNLATDTWFGWVVGAALLMLTSAIVTAGRNR